MTENGEPAAPLITKMVQFAAGLNKFCCGAEEKARRDFFESFLVRAVMEMLECCSELPVVTLCNVLSDLCFDAHPSKVGAPGQIDLKSVDLAGIHGILLEMLMR